MFIKTSELTGPDLDWAVAQCEEQPVYFHQEDWCLYMGDGLGDWAYAPSNDWAQGLPIIEEREIELQVIPAGRDPNNWAGATNDDAWSANICVPDADYIRMFGPTPLIAAMRCLIASKLGDEVEVPDELA